MSERKYEDKPGFGAIFENKKKSSDSQPDFKGEYADLDGSKKRIALWRRTSKGGVEYYSMKVEPPFEGKAQEAAPANAPSSREFDDEIPW